MKLIFKILTVPVTLAIDLFTLLCIGIISCSAIPLRLVSGIIGILGAAVLVTYSPKNGLILLTIAFLLSPMGLPMIAIWALGKLQHFSHALNGM
ncbi:MAG: CD1845 family protein [Oscillospiraceae bacterium]|nr:CD1845 family protein [Oscillospiraceae bacterium]